MNKRTINSVLTKKINDWVNSIECEELSRLVKRDVIVTGGAIASMLLGDKPKDYDIYFKTKETTIKVADYYTRKFNTAHPSTRAEVEVTEDRVKIMIKSKGVASEKPEELDSPFEDVYDVLKDDVSKPVYRPVFLSSNAITLSDDVQLVIRFYGDPDRIHENYDFVHCTNYWTPQEGSVFIPAALEALLNKELVYQGSKYPLCSVIRTRKFIKRGYTINAGQYLKMCLQISEMDLKDIKVLEDQLIGVDSAYFDMLITALKKKNEEEPNVSLDSSYVATLIDRIF